MRRNQRTIDRRTIEGARVSNERSFDAFSFLRLLPLLGLIASGCASAQAKGRPADRPGLNVPPPPPRVIEPAAQAPPEPVGDLPQPSGQPIVASPRGPRREVPPKPAGSDAKGEAKAGDQKPIEPLPIEPSPPPVQPSPQLRTPETAASSGAARNVRTTIDTAQGILNTVNYAALSNVRKKAYNDAKLFMQQADEALKQGNLVFAQAVANKAESLAKELAGR